MNVHKVNVHNMGGNDPYAVNQTRSACVYTTLIGDYEKLNEQPIAASSRLPFICLTDNPDLQSETWQIRHVKPLFGMDLVRSQRALKLCPCEYLCSFDASLYIDNSVVLKIEPEQFIERYLGDLGFVFRTSFARACSTSFSRLTHRASTIQDGFSSS